MAKVSDFLVDETEFEDEKTEVGLVVFHINLLSVVMEEVESGRLVDLKVKSVYYHAFHVD